MACVFKRGKQGIWWIKYYVNGQQVYYSLETQDARVAKRIQRQIEGEEAKGELLAPSKIPLQAFLENFCQFLLTIRTPKSYSADVSILRVFFGPICPSLELGSHINKRWRGKSTKRIPDTMEKVHIKANFLEEITPGVIEDFLARRIREDGIAPKTANRCREVLHRMFKYAIKNWHYVAADRRNPNPAALVERRKVPERTIRFLTLEEIDEQLRILQSNETIYCLVATFIYAGLRREEALWLTIHDVDLNQRLIHVCEKTIEGEHWQPKTKRNRVVPISSTLHDILSEYQVKQKTAWFFTSPKGYRWNPDNFSQDLREINQHHGLVWSCLDFRHTFGSQLAQKGESLYKIAELMGNSPEICRRHYAALVPENMHDVVEFGERCENQNSSRTGSVTSQAVRQVRYINNPMRPKLRLVR